MLGDMLKDLRNRNNKNQEELADYLGVKRQTYGAYERNVSLPDLDALKKIAKYFEVSTDYLLGLSNYQLEETFNQNVTNRQNIQTYRAIQAHIATIVDDILGDDPKQIQALQALINFINTLSEIKRFAYMTDKPEKPDFIKALDGATQNTAIYIRTGRLKFDADEFQACEKALHAFLAQYYEVLWENEHLHPDLLLSNTRSSASDVKEG